jgi:ABC-type oligopeptide transport system substrate-binding subunit
MSHSRVTVVLFALILGAGLASAIAYAKANAHGVRNGGTLRISLWHGHFDSIDPALAYSAGSGALLDPVCARLMNYPDKSGSVSFRAIPEVATSPPEISRDRKRYVFTIRKGLRFSNGAPLRADAFAHAIERLLDPAMKSPGADYVQDIVGADQVLAGTAKSPTGVKATGNRLVIRLTRPIPDFPARTTMPFFCAVPPRLPADPEGEGAFASAGPYYVSRFTPGRKLVLRRNRFYHGSRPHHVDRFVVSFDDDPIAEIEKDRADWGIINVPSYPDAQSRLIRKYGGNNKPKRFFLKPGLSFKAFALNTSQPLFRNNPSLRKAVNFAVNRAKLSTTDGGRLRTHLSDQYLPPSMPGINHDSIYPLKKPNLKEAKRLARGHLRGGKAVLYTFDIPARVAGAQIVQQNLAKIGLTVEVRRIPVEAYDDRLQNPGEPFDLAFFRWGPDYRDPYAYINELLGPTINNYAHFGSPSYRRLMAQAARLRGDARYRAYGRLSVRLARDAAPLIAWGFLNEPTLVSKHVGCIVLRPELDLTAACLKR